MTFILGLVRKSWKKILSFLVPLILLPIPMNSGTMEARCAYVALLMGLYWVIEPIPLAVTALFPVVLFPLLGVLSTERCCNFYLQETSILFIGTLVMAIAIEYSNLHQRIALKALCLIGTEIKRLLFGIMIISMFMAIWINNIATTAMMMPIMDALFCELLGKRKHSRPSQQVFNPDEIRNGGTGGDADYLNGNTVKLRVLAELEQMMVARRLSIPDDDIEQNKDSVSLTFKPVSNSKGSFDFLEDAEIKKSTERIRIIMYLSVVYGANTGAIATITSAASNVVFKFVIEEIYGERAPVDYASWFIFSLPPAVIGVVVCYAVIWTMYFWKGSSGLQKNSKGAKQVIDKKYKELGPMSFHEWGVLVLFLLLVFLWIFRDPQFARGWATYFSPIKPKDATAAMFIVIMLFVVPANPRDFFNSSGLLTWPVVQQKLQWSVILLLGGGFALAEGARESGLSQFLGDQMAGLGFLSPGLLMIVLSIITAFISELISNAGTVTILLPVFAALAEDLRINPLLLMIPATLTSNFAFILPVGTPANTIVYEHVKMQTSDMIVPGLIVKILTTLVTVLFTYILGNPIFGMFTFPKWVHPEATLNADPSSYNLSALALP